MDQTQASFSQLLQEIDFQPNHIITMSNASGDIYPREPFQIRKALGAQITQPVKFIDNIEKLYTLGIRTFIEVGPKSILTGLVKDILSERQHYAMALDPSGRGQNGIIDLANVISALAAQGFFVALDRWEAPIQKSMRMPRMRIPLNGANYRSKNKSAPTNEVVISQQSKPIIETSNDNPQSTRDPVGKYLQSTFRIRSSTIAAESDVTGSKSINFHGLQLSS